MGAENKMPDEYLSRPIHPFEKKADVKTIFGEYEIIEHTNAEADYDYLEDAESILEIVNPYRDENLFIEFGDEFTVYFSGWHAHYFAYESEYERMKRDALGIARGEYAALRFLVCGRYLGEILLTDEISPFTEPAYLISKMYFPEDFLSRIRDKGAVIFAEYWRPDDSYEFYAPSESERGGYGFPRRGGVRFIIKDGKCYGSASARKYDDQTAYIKYVSVDDAENALALRTTLIKLLEDDAKKFGMSEIFVNIDISKLELYSSLGYTEIDKIDDDRIARIDGAVLGFDKTMGKRLIDNINGGEDA